VLDDRELVEDLIRQLVSNERLIARLVGFPPPPHLGRPQLCTFRHRDTHVLPDKLSRRLQVRNDAFLDRMASDQSLLSELGHRRGLLAKVRPPPATD
jgi:hypothetical protein